MFLLTKTKLVLIFPTTFAFITLLLELFSHRALSPYIPGYYPYDRGSNYSIATTDTASFWPQFYSALVAASPRTALPRPPVLASTPRHIPYRDPIKRQDLIHLAELDELKLTEAHAWFVAQIKATSFPSPHYVAGSAGIVTAAGGKWLPVSLVWLRMLRRTGSTLPVDVFLATPDEAEGEICETVMPKLGARCRILSELLDLADGGLPRRLNVTHFQLKVFAILMSEFDNVFWMDADQMLLEDPRKFLKSEPFRSAGLVTWPDYWAETMSPAFFRIAGVPSERIPVAGWSGASEAAQLLVSKSKHLQTLELAAYYNFHGPTHYYELIGQNAYGTGDKDTFQAAALVLEAPYYKVKTPLQTLGYHHAEDDDNGRWEPMAILQANPTMDQTRFGDGHNHAGFDYVWPDEQFSRDRLQSRVPPAFLHAEQSKPNAESKVREFRGSAGPVRAYQPVDQVVEAFGYDVERVLWDEMVWTACGEELNGHVFRGWEDDWKAMLQEEEEAKQKKKKKEKIEEQGSTSVEPNKKNTRDTAGEEANGGDQMDPNAAAMDMDMDICSSIQALHKTLFGI